MKDPLSRENILKVLNDGKLKTSKEIYKSLVELAGEEINNGALSAKLSVMTNAGLLDSSWCSPSSAKIKPYKFWEITEKGKRLLSDKISKHDVSILDLDKKLLMMMGYNTLTRKVGTYNLNNFHDVDDSEHRHSAQTFRPSFGVSTAFLMMREGE